jgi:hypothetical protein
MAFNELFDETLDINSTTNYKLSIQVNLDGFYFSVLDTLRNKYVLFRAYEPDNEGKLSLERIESIYREDDFLNRSYGAVNLLVPTLKSTVVPAQLYDPAGRDDYFLLNNQKEEDEEILVTRLRYPDSFIVFSINTDLRSLLTGIFPGYDPVHHLKPLLYTLITGKQSHPEHLLHLHVEKEFMNVVLLSGESIGLCNTFEYKNTSDLMYYLLYVVKKSDLPAGIPLSVSGTTFRFDEIWSGLSDFIGNIRYAKPSGTNLFSYVFGDEILHRHLNLFSLDNCE